MPTCKLKLLDDLRLILDKLFSSNSHIFVESNILNKIKLLTDANKWDCSS